MDSNDLDLKPYDKVTMFNNNQVLASFNLRDDGSVLLIAIGKIEVLAGNAIVIRPATRTENEHGEVTIS